MNDPVKFIENLLHNIIDEVHPLFRAVTDEELIEDHEDHGVFERTFCHAENQKLFRMKWRVYYGTPETVRTVFEPAEHVGYAS